MSKFTNRADLLIAAGESIKMQESAGIKPMCKVDGDLLSIDGRMLTKSFDYEFPLAVVEGKAVFLGDKLYYEDYPTPSIVDDIWNPKGCFDAYSWNPPKPRTVMVELLREDAEWLSDLMNSEGVWTRIRFAANKSLDEQ